MSSCLQNMSIIGTGQIYQSMGPVQIDKCIKLEFPEGIRYSTGKAPCKFFIWLGSNPSNFSTEIKTSMFMAKSPCLDYFWFGYKDQKTKCVIVHDVIAAILIIVALKTVGSANYTEPYDENTTSLPVVVLEE